ncbi:hypothetical protein ACKRLN_08860 [Anaerococcus sp. DFU013_CI05]|uniref:hypothetical protein n=1 Tax=unclassified Anaerococcus TaxID=2614126 RepID=UPI001932F9BD|nr:hypothetical protein [Anaerococcus sp. mt242]MBM0047018.1 hypothetical protein [Anaerococcus sp. mt242]
MKKIKTQELTVMAICLALMVVLGTVLYFVGRSLPIPGGRLLAMAPAFSFIFTALILRIKKIGVISFVSFVFGIFLLKFSIFGVLAIWISAFLADILTFLLIRNYKSYKDIYLTVPINGFFQVWTSYIVVMKFVPESKFTQAALIPTLILSVVVYLIGYYSSKYFLKLMERRSLLGEKFEDKQIKMNYEKR